MAKKQKLTEEEKQKLKIERHNQIMALYKVDPDKVEFLGEDKKNSYYHNPDNERILRDTIDNAPFTIDVRAYTDIYVLDVFMEKPKPFVTMIKRISGKDLTNPRFEGKALIMTVNGDQFYGLSEQRKKYYFLKELSRLTWNEEKESYKVLKYEYQNNYNLLDLYGTHPSEEQLADL